MNRKPEVIEDELPRELFRRYGWTLPASRGPTAAGSMAPACYALVLVRGGAGEWDLAEMKGFEDVADAERWARSLAQDAARAESG